MVRISVIIPVYNVEQYLRQCLDSVLTQTLKEIEVVCVDDGSGDHSYDILLEYQKKYENVIVLRQSNQGAGPARNYGMSKAAGKYFCFMDPDDYYAQNCALERLYLAAEENHASVCGGNMISKSTDGDEQERRPWFYVSQFVDFVDFGDTGSFQRYLFLSELIRQNNIIFPSYRRYQDPPFLMKAMLCAQRFYEINELIYIYRTDHKKINYTLEKSVDLLCGIRDCYEMAQKYNLVTTYYQNLKNILKENLGAFYQYAIQNRREVWDLIEQICSIHQSWMRNPIEEFRDRDYMEIYVARQREEREKLLSVCSASQIIIYGAGEAGRYFLKHFGNKCNHIAGFAVSKKGSNEDFIEGYPVREITKYNPNDFVVVAVSEQYAAEVLNHLAKLQFKNVCYVEYEIFPFLEGE